MLTKSHLMVFANHQLWLRIAKVIGLTAIAITVIADFSMPELMQRSDFLMDFYVAGHMVAHGHASALYPGPTATSFSHAPFDLYSHHLLKFIDSDNTVSTPAYMYSPLNALLFAPFSYLSPTWALLSWQTLCLICLFLCAFLVSKLTEVQASTIFWMSMLLTPILHTFLIGQLGIVFGLLPLFVGFYFLNLNKPIAAGFAWATIILKPQFLPVVGLLILCRSSSSHHRLIVGWLSGLIALTLLTLTIFGADVLISWLNCLKLAENTYDFPAHLHIGLPATVLSLATNSQRGLVKIVVYGLALTLSLVTLFFSEKIIATNLPDVNKLVLISLVACALTPLIVPHFLYYDLCLLAFAGMLFYCCNWNITGKVKLTLIVTTTWVVIDLYPLLVSCIKQRSAPAQILVLFLCASFFSIIARAKDIISIHKS